jgi:hypothetical protein
MRKSSKVFVGTDLHKESIDITLAEVSGASGKAAHADRGCSLPPSHRRHARCICARGRVGALLNLIGAILCKLRAFPAIIAPL